GIGLGIAEELAKSGFQIAINGRRDASDVADSIKKIESRGVKCLYCRGDVTSDTERKSILDHIEKEFGRLDVLVNNAGVAPDKRADILEADEASFDRLIGINLKGPYFLTQAAANWMIRQHKAHKKFRGCIINVSSVSATVASVNRGDYCISKAGIAMATQLWAARLTEYNIDVFEVRPGIIATDMTSGVKGKYDALIEGGLLLDKRWGKPEDIGKAVSALARGDVPYAPGQVLVLDGGLTLPRL
ncbi:MAG: 3-ketoacyl-ACP reductase, partial [Phycisphaerae bacterium]|nr:3-ketoacyl-ACP reductase [Phycisphaerae bacterium]